MTELRGANKLSRPDGEEIAYLTHAPETRDQNRIGLTWLGGFKSDMTGTKAQVIDDYARMRGRHYLRFDYFGHGASSGDFRQGTVGRWKEDALAAIDALAEGPQVLIGSSMGGWIALLAALARPDRVKGLVLIAPAPDFTEELMWKKFSPEVQETLRREGIYFEPTPYSDAPNEITLELIEEGRAHLLLDKPVNLTCPVRIVQGMADEDVPYTHAMRLMDGMTSADMTMTLVKGGDHRLSTPDDLARLARTLDEIIAAAEDS